MKMIDALEIVLDLASQNALDPEHCDADLIDEAKRQQEAIKVVTESLNPHE